MSGPDRIRGHGGAQRPAGRGSRPPEGGRTGPECLECGGPLAAARPGAEFCSGRCRTAFHTRRKQRGALLYDFYMPHRHERDEAAELRLLTMMNRLAAKWKAEDDARRAGRRSWRRPRAVLARMPWLHAEVLKQMKRRDD